MKTLKDMITPKFKWKFINRSDLMYRKELWLSAIDDIKNLNEEIDKCTADLDNYKQFEFEAIIDYIMDKFNITDEDLKEVTEDE